MQIKNNNITCHTYQMGENVCLIIPSISQDVEKRELPYIIGGRVHGKDTLESNFAILVT